MGSARTRSRSAAVLNVGVALLDGVERQGLDVLTTSTGSQAARRHRQAVVGSEVVGRHLSETACVHGSGRLTEDGVASG